MDAVPRNLADKFADAYAGQKIGFSAKEITDYFSSYSNLVKPAEHYAMGPTRWQLFVESLYALRPKEQYYALNDLAFIERPSKYPYPAAELRQQLLRELHTFISPVPIGLSFSTLRETHFREDWVSACSLVHTNPPAAITAARTMLETVFKTIVAERSQEPDSSGDLGRLLKQAETVLGFSPATEQARHMIFSGLTSVASGIASLSNSAGDRHGLVKGSSIDDPSVALLCVHAAGTVGIAFIECHLLAPR